MTRQEFVRLNMGDLITSKASGATYIVTGNYGSRVTAVHTVDVTNLDEWTVTHETGLTPVEEGRNDGKRPRPEWRQATTL